MYQQLLFILDVCGSWCSEISQSKTACALFYINNLAYVDLRWYNKPTHIVIQSAMLWSAGRVLKGVLVDFGYM